jgi:hypothetical protein
MRTIVVYEVGNSLKYKELTDTPRVPSIGETVHLSGSQYTVIDIHTCPEQFKPDGITAQKGFDKLIEVLTTLHGDAMVVQSLIQSLESIGSGERPQVTPGGLIVVGANKQLEFDDLIYVQLKLKTRRAAGFAQQLAQVQTLLAATPEAAGTSQVDTSTVILPPITLDDSAATDESAA